MPLRLIAILCLVLLPLGAPRAEDTPARTAFPEDDFTLSEYRIPMRDGVELYTLVLTPKGAAGPLPVLLERTPYDASDVFGSRATTQLAVMRGPYFAGKGFIYVFQDIRGRFRSGGEYAMYRVPRGAFNTSNTDETTDAWDTIDWLVKKLPGNNGKVGIWGVSYPGWLALAALREPHPALAAAIPFNPVVDAWKSDDWFHWGAFRIAYSFDYIFNMETDNTAYVSYPYPERDLYTWLLGKGSAAHALSGLLDQRHEMWPRLIQNPAYGPYWKDVAADRWFDKPTRRVPTLHVHGLFDQEDIYGAPAVYAAMERHDAANDANFLAIGPWFHGQQFREGSTLGPLNFDEDTAKRFREDVMIPFLKHALAGGPDPHLAPVTAFETGRNRWRHFDAWPAGKSPVPLYLQPAGGLGFTAPPRDGGFAEYVSDPAKPVPHVQRPVLGVNYDDDQAIAQWRSWLVQDQRFVDGRPDVVTWQSEPLTQTLTIRGAPQVFLQAETTGTDADWVVKLIDVFPGQDPEDAARSGMQIMIAANIFRGRYRESLEQPAPIKANRALEYRFPLPEANHSFLPGHKVMVQVQSSWFPLYDRNPQSWVPSIMEAPPEAYRAARQRIHTSAAHASRIVLPVDESLP